MKAIILYNVKVDDNVISVAGILIDKDVPSSGVWGSARLICIFDDYLQKRRKFIVEYLVDNIK